jgi:stringent starvation protein B
MTSSRPYLVRALYEWINDNGMTPYVLADASIAGVSVPDSAIQEGKVTLNISAQAVQALHLGDDEVTFSARFGGVARTVSLPVPAVLAIYASENGQGMMFPAEETQAEETPSDEPSAEKPEKPGGHLKVVK